MTARSLFARLYDFVMNAADRAGLARRRRSLARSADGLVLEIGAGTGLEFAHYRAGVQVVAIEPNAAMLARSSARRSQSKAAIWLVIADARALPFRDGAFDTAISALAFCTIPEPERAATEMRRVLHASGTARLLEHVRATHQPLAKVQVMLTPVWSRLAGGCHLDRLTGEVIRRAGFNVSIEYSAFDGTLVELAAQRVETLVAAARPGMTHATFSGASASAAIVQ